ncbi:Transcription elongation factor B polypeptide 3, partial [Pseudolycoriella hygida]
ILCKFKFVVMTTIVEAIKHYQRRIDRSLENKEALLHCLQKLNKLPIDVKYLEETKVGRTVNNLRKHDGEVGFAATELVAKWKIEVAKSSGDQKQLPTDDTENVEPSVSTPNSDIFTCASYSKSCRSERSQEKSSQLGKKNSDEVMSKSHDSRRPTSTSNYKRESGSHHRDRERRKSSQQRQCEQTNDEKNECGSHLIDIDSTMGASFGETLRMLDMPSTSKPKKIPTTPGERRNSSKCFYFDETPMLLKKRPRLEPSMDIAAELLSPASNATNSEASTLECTFREPVKQTTQMTAKETIDYNVTSRTTKTKVFSGNKADSKCKIASLFEMCMYILQDNIDLLEFTGGVPFDILRPVLERTTYKQLMTLEDYNPYLMEDTHCLWEQHCKRRFRTKRREELETWREMYIRCLDEEQTKFNSLTATIKLSKERQTKPAFVDSNPLRNAKSKNSSHRATTSSHAEGNVTFVGGSKLVNVTKSQNSFQTRKRSKKSNDDPDWTPTSWYKTLYKKFVIVDKLRWMTKTNMVGTTYHIVITMNGVDAMIEVWRTFNGPAVTAVVKVANGTFRLATLLVGKMRAKGYVAVA